jgi:hypothetical protein
MDRFYSIILLIILAAAGVLRIGQYMQSHGTVSFGDTKVKVEIATTPDDMAKGLSNRKSLGENDGMLFVFSEPGTPAFWMKDMEFSLDIIWIQNDTVVDIASNLPPLAGDYVSTYAPRVPANYVLEVNAGFTAKHRIKIGDKVDVKI